MLPVLCVAANTSLTHHLEQVFIASFLQLGLAQHLGLLRMPRPQFRR